MLDAGRQHGITFSIVRGSDMDLSTPSGRALADILGALAQAETEMKSDRQKRAAEQAAEQGRWVGGRRAFGYTGNGLALVPAEAVAIREGAAALLAGASLRGIAEAWNAAGLRTGQRPRKTAKDAPCSPFRADSVRRVLSNPRNAKLRTHLGEERAASAGPEIIDVPTLRAVQAVLGNPERRTGAVGHPPQQLVRHEVHCCIARAAGRDERRCLWI